MSETALALVQSITAVEFFKPGASKSILENLKIEVRAQAAKLDISTEEGRKDIASLAFKVAKSKTGLDKAGKELVADQKAAIKRIDAERATVWDELEALQKEVRQPLTDFEEAEAQRIASHEAALDGMVVAGEFCARNWQTMPVEDMRTRLAAITNSQRDWQEFLARAKQTVVTVIGQIKTAIAQREKMDADATELEALRAAAAVQAQKDRDAQIAKEAREAAESAARERAVEQAREAEKERQRIEDERIQAEARAKQAEAQREQERIAAEEALRLAQEQAREAAEQAERTRLATEEAARLAEQRRVEAEERAAREAEEAAERMRVDREQDAQRLRDEQARALAAMQEATAQAERDRQAEAERARVAQAVAVEAERVRIEAERTAEAERVAEEARKRENNRKHAAKINGEVKAALNLILTGTSCTDANDMAQAIVVAIAQGKIPHTKISY